MEGNLESRIKEGVMLFNVGTYRQTLDFSCGPSALKIILDSFGRNITEEELIELTGAKERVGTTPDNLYCAASKLGYRIFQHTNATFADIETFLKGRLPVLVAYQSPENKPYGAVLHKNTDKWGHYAVVVGANRTHLFLSNPEEDCGYTIMHKDIFLNRWWDRDMVDRKFFERWFMVVFPEKFQFISAEGSNYEIGFAIGNSCQESIEILLECVGDEYEQKTKKKFSAFIKAAQQFLPLCKELFPQYVKELKGMAEGAEVDFSELFALNCLEELDWTGKNPLMEKCTTIVSYVDDSIALAHNEDYSIYPINSLYIVKVKQKRKPSFLSIGYVGSLPGSSVGINDKGIAMAGNSINVRDCRKGILKNFICRAILDERYPLGIPEKICSIQRAIGGNYSIVSSKGSYFVETTALECAIKKIDQLPAFHTNHFTSPDLENKEAEVSQSSRLRYERLKKLLDSGHGDNLSLEDIKSVLANHDDLPLSVCRHDYEGSQRQGSPSTTLASIIMKPTERVMHIAEGNPCMSKYEEYSL